MRAYGHMVPAVLILVVGAVGCSGTEDACQTDGDCPGHQVCTETGGVMFGTGVCMLRCSGDRAIEACRRQGGECEHGYCVNIDGAVGIAVKDAGGDPPEDSGGSSGGEAGSGDTETTETANGGDPDCTRKSKYDFCLDHGLPCQMVTAEDRCGMSRTVNCGALIDFDTDELHCGGCGQDCDFQNATGECRQGMCVIDLCEDGYVDADGDGRNGCETEAAGTEKCGDDSDNDGDGDIDENCPCNYRGQSDGVCVTAMKDGQGNCQEPSGYEGQENACEDNRDNDCDGDTDGEDSSCTVRAIGDSCQNASDCATGACVADASGSAVCAHRIFVTSATSSGKLNGLSGADATCNRLATAASLGGSWKAILSTGGTPARDRISVDSAIVNMNGDVLETDPANLWNGKVDDTVDYDEEGDKVGGFVWTGTRADGTSASTTCQSWTTRAAAESGQHGEPSATDQDWIEDTGDEDCDAMGRLYCIDGQ